MTFKPHIIPSDSGFATIFTNDPNLMMGLGLGPQSFSEIPEETAVAPMEGGQQLLTPQGPITDLMSLRSRFPFLPIMPIPPEAASIILDTANVAKDMPIPDGSVLGVFSCTAPVFVSRNGNAEVPSLTNTGMVQDSVQSKSFLLPDKLFVSFYVSGIRSLSFANATANTIVSGMFYTPDQYPR